MKASREDFLHSFVYYLNKSVDPTTSDVTASPTTSYSSVSNVFGQEIDLVDVMKKTHMRNTLLVLGVADIDQVEDMIFYNDIVVKLMAPLGGIGQPPSHSDSLMGIVTGSYSTNFDFHFLIQNLL